MTPDLDDQRIAKMRTYVEGAVDLEVRRRGRRVRRLAGGGLAACLVVVVGGVGVQLADPTTTSSDLTTSSTRGATADSSADAGGSGTNELRRTTEEPDPDAAGDRDVVVTGSIRATVGDTDRTVRALNRWLVRNGGRIDGQSRSGSGTSASASLTLRVPRDRVDAAADEVARLGRVDDVSVRREDVGAERRDLDARIEALQISVDRLQAIMSAADKSSDLLSAEQALSRRQADLESLQAERLALADSIGLSTIQVDLATRASAQAPSDEGFASGLVDGWNALVGVVGGLVLALGFVLPWLVVAAGGGALWGAARRWRRR
ncbi:hypothetical protein ASD11_12500 [Aeromicrobium sp. Root495]|uniref:DUF4349 domain-containing protein n=1 Tax=Aeromicrobium sp. Root495 TaxID=1736550 RepID=UPI0006FA5226|nr:DUF4349 domain-containing protein [Aeromicrobium sp. Root495]KQY60276.1 hypothetical protein ASD11_12500 [Aeromicrobium sp. Root495]